MSNIRFLTAAAFAAALVAPCAAFAQTPTAPVAPPPAVAPHHHGHHRHNPMRAAMRKLNLSADQHARIAALFAQAKQQRQAKRNADPATRKANRQAFRAQIDGILTPQQRTQFHAALAQAHARHHRAPGAMTPPAPQTPS